MRMGPGEYRFVVCGEMRSCSHWDDIPEVIDDLIAFKPDVPTEPHSEEEHAAIDALPAKLQEIMERCQR